MSLQWHNTYVQEDWKTSVVALVQGCADNQIRMKTLWYSSSSKCILTDVIGKKHFLKTCEYKIPKLRSFRISQYGWYWHMCTKLPLVHYELFLWIGNPPTQVHLVVIKNLQITWSAVWAEEQLGLKRLVLVLVQLGGGNNIMFRYHPYRLSWIGHIIHLPEVISSFRLKPDPRRHHAPSFKELQQQPARKQKSHGLNIVFRFVLKWKKFKPERFKLLHPAGHYKYIYIYI